MRRCPLGHGILDKLQRGASIKQKLKLLRPRSLSERCSHILDGCNFWQPHCYSITSRRSKHRQLTVPQSCGVPVGTASRDFFLKVYSAFAIVLDGKSFSTTVSNRDTFVCSLTIALHLLPLLFLTLPSPAPASQVALVIFGHNMSNVCPRKWCVCTFCIEVKLHRVFYCICRGPLGNIAVSGQRRRCNIPVQTYLHKWFCKSHSRGLG